jgi:protocatechuate 3,4-dioxygenase beta subunit
LICFPISILAHPGHDVREEAAERAAFVKRSPRAVQSCASELARRGHTIDAVKRRQELAQGIVVKRTGGTRTLHRRDSTGNSTHHSGEAFGLGTDETLLFADNSSCILQTEVTQGPYYVDGELIRHDLTEDQPGVPLYLDIQIIDTSTCLPVPALYMDFWHCNSTGVYSGVSATGNGNVNDTSNLDATFLRGIQQTDINGVVQFQTVFPGHYTGRATHVHILTHNPNSTTIRTNATLLGSSGNATTHASHVGQLFFDQDLISQVEAVEPYASNTQDVTLNTDDMILSQEANTMDPYVEYVLLGEDVSDGILAWISIGIDPTMDNEISAAAIIYEDGGVASENTMGGGPGGDSAEGPPSGDGDVAPSGSGAVPSGSPPASGSAV